MGKFIDRNTAVKIVRLFALLKRQRQSHSAKYELALLNAYLEFYFGQRAKYELIEYYNLQIANLSIDYSLNYDLWIDDINRELDFLSKCLNHKQRYKLAFTLFEYLQFLFLYTNTNEDQNAYDDCINSITHYFKLNETVCFDIKAILGNNFALLKKTENVIVVGQFRNHKPKRFASIEVENIKGKVWAYYIPQIDSFAIKYLGKSELLLNSYILSSDCIYQLSKGGIVYNDTTIVISYSQLRSRISQQNGDLIELEAKNLSYKYKRSIQGVKPISFKVCGGELLAIMGGSGTGKTTLVSLLSGRIKPESGKVQINGLELHNKKHISTLSKQIGFVPQMDLLNEDLTVWQNLNFYAQLSRDNLSKQQRETKVEHLLKELGLEKSRNLKVGNAVEKVISGGQRKRLNISLELIREPSILILDEPSSGLSSKDALQVILMLREIANQGKIVIINIHQPTSEIFHQLDKLVIMDSDGYPVYFGEPFNAAAYFKKHLNLMDSSIDDTIQIGYYNPEQIMELIEYKGTDKLGNQLRKRVFSPANWYEKFNKSLPKSYFIETALMQLPEVGTHLPAYLKQMAIYFKRNLISRIADKSYLLFSLLGSPLLAFLISSLLRESTSDDGIYSYGSNINIPVFIFIGVVVSLFLGMINSVGEINKDKRQLTQESYLNLSSSAYLLSKILYLLLINFYQIAIYVFISNKIISVQGLYWQYFITYWVASCVMSMVGLYVSIKISSTLSTYLAIPFILIPQILLAGAILDFDDIHRSISNKRYVPTFANLMVSRWTYEAIVDIQFNENLFSRSRQYLYIKQSSADYYINFFIPKLKSLIESNAEDGNFDNRLILINGLNELSRNYPNLPIYDVDLHQTTNVELYNLLENIRLWFIKVRALIREELTNEQYRTNLKPNEHENKRLKEIVLKRNRYLTYTIYENEIIRKFEPAYYINPNKNGRSHLYAPYKNIGNFTIKTWKFNVMVLLLMNLLIVSFVLIALSKKYSRK
jgi:ABC-type multidrug transport system ATPase subunit